MSRLRTSVVPAFAAAAVLGIAGAAVPALAAGAGSSHPVSVSPRIGGPSATFRVHLQVLAATGRVATVTRRDVVTVSGHRARGCVSSLAATARPAHRGARETVALSPGHGRVWCPGTFHGTVTQVVAFHCPSSGVACDPPAIRPVVLGRFSFRVVASSSGGSGSGGSGGGSGGSGGGSGGSGGGSGGSAGPSFAGLASASYCQGSPVHPGSPTYTLSWNAASDPNTPSSQIVYDIFMSATSGGENYSQPTAVTQPGATSDSLSEPASSSAPFFVVRAVDQAGHSDGNTIERQATNSCSNGA